MAAALARSRAARLSCTNQTTAAAVTSSTNAPQPNSIDLRLPRLPAHRLVVGLSYGRRGPEEVEISLSASMISVVEPAAGLPRWEAIDTVLLDMDGTLL